MPDEVSVDLDALERAADGVAGTLEALAARKVNDLDPAVDAFGHERLGQTVRDFCERWQIGVGHLAEDGREIAARLAASAANYRAADQAAADSLTAILRRLDQTGGG